ncbi:MAG: zinc ribbon domain-containing protein [Gemmatimonadaceae bacterium]|nr:zinc ribbon domain-containing protein [Gemmatimonadaceae bacterium]
MTTSASSSCAVCKAALSPGARFCHRCGTPAGARPEAPAGGGTSTVLPWSIAAVSLIILITLVATRTWQASTAGVASAEAPPGGMVAPFANGGGGGGAPPDISQMSPEERADRLYNRVMTYAERGVTDSAAFFSPMAMMAYNALGQLSNDQRYHVGSIGLATGAKEGAEIALAQSDTLLAADGNYLLGLMLAARANEILGNAPKQKQFEAKFLKVLDAELKKPVDEYAAHRPSIDAAANTFKSR